MSSAGLKALLVAATPQRLKPIWLRLESPSVSSRLARGAFWSLFGALTSRLLGLIASILVARWLGKEGFGQLGIIQATVGMFGTVAGFGLGATATKYVAEWREQAPERAGRIISLSAVVSWVMGILTTLALVLLAPWLAARTLAAPQLALALEIGSPLLLLGAVNGAQTGALAGFEAFKRIAQLNFLAGLSNFAFLPLGVWFFGLPGAIGGLAASQAIGCALNRWALAQEARRWKVPVWSPDWRSEVSVLWRFSLPIVSAALLVSPTLWYCQSILAQQPSGYQGLAEYSVGVQWRALVQYAPGLLSAGFLPVFCSLAAPKDAVRRRALMVKFALFSGFFTFLTAIPVVLLASPILLAYGPTFQGGKPIFSLMLLAGVADATNNILVQSLVGMSRTWFRLISNGVWAIAQAATAWLLIPKYGPLGLAASVCAAQFIHLGIQFPLALLFCRRGHE
jgi:O-antigen/teichoic acid export membrane protein